MKIKNINKLKDKIKKENDNLSSFFKIDEFKRNFDDSIKLKIIDIILSKYYNKNFEGNKEKYLLYINTIKIFCNTHIFDNKIISLEVILGLHEVILSELWYERKETTVGVLRKVHSINRGKMLIDKAKITSFIATNKVEEVSKHIIKDYNENIDNDSLTNVVNLVLPFWIYIHPFENSNGKVFYILLDMLLWKHGYWPIFLSHPNNIYYFRELLQKYSDTKDLNQAKIDFYKIILKIYKNYKIY